jgi:hypothetical protein
MWEILRHRRTISWRGRLMGTTRRQRRNGIPDPLFRLEVDCIGSSLYAFAPYIRRSALIGRSASVPPGRINKSDPTTSSGGYRVARYSIESAVVRLCVRRLARRWLVRHPIQDATDEEIRDKTDVIIDRVIAALTKN